MAGLLAASVSAQNAPRTLREVFDASLKASETVLATEQSIIQAEALYRQAFAGSFPELSVRSDTTWDQKRSYQYRGANENAYLRLAQTGLTGIREAAAWKAGKALVGRREAELFRAEQQLLSAVAGAYFGFLQSRENGATFDRLISQADKRLTELRDRVRVGRSREADVTSQDLQSISLQSQREESRRLIEARGDLLGFLIKGQVGAELAEGPESLTDKPLTEYLSRLESRPDVRAAARQRELAEADRESARALHFPQFSMAADHYFGRSVPNVDHNRWDASFNVALPLWSWGARSAAVNSASAGYAAAELALQGTRRAAELEVKNAWRDYASAKRQLALQRRAADTARKDYELNGKDERRGLVTALEALTSLDRLASAELNYTNARLATRLAAIALENASGTPFESMEMLK
ncbi:MAG: TolC family protein [Elusimicrobia bacterium]|nr:TolC family protein [Elusimicrobiota bacterium]